MFLDKFYMATSAWALLIFRCSCQRPVSVAEEAGDGLDRFQGQVWQVNPALGDVGQRADGFLEPGGVQARVSNWRPRPVPVRSREGRHRPQGTGS